MLQECVRIYDSAMNTISFEVKKATCSILRPKEDFFSFDLANVLQQPNSWDCGVFSVAYATELVHRRSPCNAIFDAGLLRSHLLECLEKGTLKKKLRRVGFGSIVKCSTREEIHCVCRMVRDPLLPMAECIDCFKLFHFGCVGLRDGSVNKVKWKCEVCRSVFLK